MDQQLTTGILPFVHHIAHPVLGLCTNLTLTALTAAPVQIKRRKRFYSVAAFANAMGSFNIRIGILTQILTC